MPYWASRAANSRRVMPAALISARRLCMMRWPRTKKRRPAAAERAAPRGHGRQEGRQRIFSQHADAMMLAATSRHFSPRLFRWLSFTLCWPAADAAERARLDADGHAQVTTAACHRAHTTTGTRCHFWQVSRLYKPKTGHAHISHL